MRVYQVLYHIKDGDERADINHLYEFHVTAYHAVIVLMRNSLEGFIKQRSEWLSDPSYLSKAERRQNDFEGQKWNDFRHDVAFCDIYDFDNVKRVMDKWNELSGDEETWQVNELEVRDQVPRLEVPNE